MGYDYDKDMEGFALALMKMKEIDNDVKRQLAIEKDSEGYAFLTNTAKGEDAPFEFAKRYGFINPVFKVKEAWLPDKREFQFRRGVPDEIVKENREWLWRTDESWWVKEGVDKNESV